VSAASAVADAPLPRADAPRRVAPSRGFFPFATAGLAGLPFEFWVLQGYLFLATSVLDEELPSLGKFRPRLLLGLFALVIAGGRALVEGLSPAQAERIRSGPSRWLMAFLATGFLSTVWAFEPGLAWDPNLEHAISILAFFLLILIVRTRREALLTVLVFCAGTGTYLLVAWWEWLHGRHDYAQGVVRMMGPGQSFADPNSFAATVAFAMPLVVWAGTWARSWLVRLSAVAYAGLGAMSILNSSSRSGLVLLGLTVPWTVWALPSAKARVAVVVVLALLASSVVATLSPEQVKRIESIFSSDTYERESSTLGRKEGYEVGWRIFRENPVLGVGPGNWSAYRTRRVDGRPLMPHNLGGQLVATRGLLGTVAFVGFVVSSVLFGWREARRRRRSTDPWDRATRALVGSCLFVLVLLFVSGLAAHNLERAAWSWAPALVVLFVTCRPDPDPAPDPAEALA
jgi:O-antigen ligase